MHSMCGARNKWRWHWSTALLDWWYRVDVSSKPWIDILIIYIASTRIYTRAAWIAIWTNNTVCCGKLDRFNRNLIVSRMARGCAGRCATIASPVTAWWNVPIRY
jgi:hypothetical protein